MHPVGDRELLRWIRGLTGAGRVPSDDAERIREPFQLGSPAAGVTKKPVEQYQRRAVARGARGDREAVHVDGTTHTLSVAGNALQVKEVKVLRVEQKGLLGGKCDHPGTRLRNALSRDMRFTQHPPPPSKIGGRLRKDWEGFGREVEADSKTMNSVDPDQALIRRTFARGLGRCPRRTGPSPNRARRRKWVRTFPSHRTDRAT